MDALLMYRVAVTWLAAQLVGLLVSYHYNPYIFGFTVLATSALSAVLAICLLVAIVRASRRREPWGGLVVLLVLIVLLSIAGYAVLDRIHWA